MAYELIYSQKVLKQLKKLDKLTQEKLILSLERVRVRPHSYVKKLVANPYYRLRTGNYRIILDIKNNQLIIHVIEIGHRRNIYK